MSTTPNFPDSTRARYFAEMAHSGQSYNDDVPYTVHLDNVVSTLARFGFSGETWRCCGYLHDVIEDTRKSYGDILARFGPEVAERVYAVTNELGRNRGERNAKTYLKIAENNDAIILKLADRIANVQYGLENGGKQDMYAKEFPAFAKALFKKDHAEAKTMWVVLSRLLDKVDVIEALL